MARIRTIKPEFWKHEDLSALPEATHFLAAALLNYADDEGYFNANPRLIQAELFPLREPSVSIRESLKYLADIGYIRLGVGPNGRDFGHIVNFLEHQRINRPTPSKISCLEILWEPSENTHEQLSEPSPPERNREQGTGNREKEARKARDEKFDEFWNVYPRKEDKGHAKTAFRSACKKADPDSIIAAVKATKFSDERKFIPLPTTWLNGERWLDVQDKPEKPTVDPEKLYQSKLSMVRKGLTATRFEVSQAELERMVSHDGVSVEQARKYGYRTGDEIHSIQPALRRA